MGHVVPAQGDLLQRRGFFHTYYMVMLAPAVGALAGIGVAQLWHDFQRRTDWHAWVCPRASS